MDIHLQKKIVLLGSLAGCVLLLFIGEFQGVQSSTISRLDQLPLGKEIEVQGEVVGVRDTDKVIFMEIAEQKVEKVSVVLFKGKNLSIQKGDYVTVTGSMTDYKGSREIIASRVIAE